MLNLPWRSVHLNLVAFLVFHIVALFVLLVDEFEHAVVVHGHRFAAHHVVVELVVLFVIFDLLQNSKGPRKHLSHLICFADEKLAVGRLSEAAQDNWRLDHCQLADPDHVDIAQRRLRSYFRSRTNHNSAGVQMLKLHLDIAEVPKFRFLSETRWAIVSEYKVVRLSHISSMNSLEASIDADSNGRMPWSHDGAVHLRT